MNNADKAAVLYDWLENHLNIINTYSQALETLDNYKGNIFSNFSCMFLNPNIFFQFEF